MKVTINGIVFEGSEEEIERVVQRYAPPVPVLPEHASPYGLATVEAPRGVTTCGS